MTTDLLKNFHPVLAEWFKRSFGQPTDVQAKGWASIGIQLLGAERDRDSLVLWPSTLE